MNSNLPPGWTAKESKSHPGKVYYVSSTGETTWDRPTVASEVSNADQVQVLHILKKHRASRRPSSWRCENITQTKEEAMSQVSAIRERIDEVLKTKGFREAEALFRSFASEESDCSSAQRGGDLGSFGRGQMQKSFEDSSFSLTVGGLSALVDSDSGIHIILRIK